MNTLKTESFLEVDPSRLGRSDKPKALDEEDVLLINRFGLDALKFA